MFQKSMAGILIISVMIFDIYNKVNNYIMRQMTFQQFKLASDNLKKFMAEQDKLDAVLKVINPTSTGVCEFGNKFIDDYISVVEIALGDDEGWFSWFVFENEFGKKKMKVSKKNIPYIIKNESDLYYRILAK